MSCRCIVPSSPHWNPGDALLHQIEVRMVSRKKAATAVLQEIMASHPVPVPRLLEPELLSEPVQVAFAVRQGCPKSRTGPGRTSTRSTGLGKQSLTAVTGSYRRISGIDCRNSSKSWSDHGIPIGEGLESELLSQPNHVPPEVLLLVPEPLRRLVEHPFASSRSSASSS